MSIFDEIGDLPTHPLAVHAPVVIVPLAAAVAIVYAFSPLTLRRYLGWALAFLGAASPVVAWFAVQSGKHFANKLGISEADAVEKHQNFGEMTFYFSIALAIAALGLVTLDHFRYRDRNGQANIQQKRALLSTILSVILGILAVVVTYYVIRAGHSGATMVWKV